MKKIGIFWMVLLMVFSLSAQDFQCQLSINSTAVAGSNRNKFNTLQQELYKFVNDRKWCQYTLKTNERIECAIMIRMQHIENEIISLDTSLYVCQNLVKQSHFLRFDTHTVFFLSGREWLYPMPEPVQVDVLCIQHNPRIPMCKLLQTFRFRTLLIDGTNSPYYEQRWIDSCQVYHIPCHSTRRDGYFSL